MHRPSPSSSDQCQSEPDASEAEGRRPCHLLDKNRHLQQQIIYPTLSHLAWHSSIEPFSIENLTLSHLAFSHWVNWLGILPLINLATRQQAKIEIDCYSQQTERTARPIQSENLYLIIIKQKGWFKHSGSFSVKSQTGTLWTSTGLPSSALA